MNKFRDTMMYSSKDIPKNHDIVTKVDGKKFNISRTEYDFPMK